MPVSTEPNDPETPDFTTERAVGATVNALPPTDMIGVDVRGKEAEIGTGELTGNVAIPGKNFPIDTGAPFAKRTRCMRSDIVTPL